MEEITRRGFLKSAGVVAGVPVMPTILSSLLAMQEASATTTSDYKALVCVFLTGGNDAYNTLVYADENDHAVYRSKRKNVYLPLVSTTETLNKRVLDLPELASTSNNPGKRMALNDKLPFLHNAYLQGRVAIVANMGPLKDGTNNVSAKASQQTTVWPAKLFSHNDQTSTWLTGQLEGQSQIGGWGGRLVAANSQALPANSTSLAKPLESINLNMTSSFGSSTISSNSVRAFAANSQTGVNKPASLSYDEYSSLLRLSDGINTTGCDFTDERFVVPLFAGAVGSTKVGTATHILESVYADKMKSTYDLWKYLRMEENGNPKRLPINLNTNSYETELYLSSDANGISDVGNELWQQLAVVAEFIKNQQAIGVKRQVFYVQLGGFDTHSGQTRGGSAHDVLLQKLDRALNRFDQALGDVRNQVTTFTASEFGRKLLENGDGTDHGWGGHHFVMGGAQVRGGNIYGKIPTLALDSSGKSFTDTQLLPDGTMIPKVSVDQFAWELAKWFGVPDSAKATVFPSYFPIATGITLNFMA